MPWAAVEAIVAGDRLPGWADDFPDVGDQKGPPESGETEIGYNIVPSRQGRGYATEAVRTLLAMAWAHPQARSVTASTAPGNVASQRVLEKAGFALAATTDEKHYRIHRPADAALPASSTNS